MARLLVTGPSDGLGPHMLLEHVVAEARDAGHDAFLFGTQHEAPLDAVKESDGIVAVLDGTDATTAAIVAFGHATQKPILALTSRGQPDAPRVLTDAATHQATLGDAADIKQALEPFYEEVRPFAGRLVRDLIPRLVKEAGHAVTFRELSDEEKPRHLKQKLAEEARQLAAADLSKEKEEIADVLEVLETLIQVRGHGRDALRGVKEAKRKRRGGFERCFVVESTAARDNSKGVPPEAPAKRDGEAEEPKPAEPAFFEV